MSVDTCAVLDLPSVETCDDIISMAQKIIDNPGNHNLGRIWQAEKDIETWRMLREFAVRLADAVARTEAAEAHGLLRDSLGFVEAAADTGATGAVRAYAAKLVGRVNVFLEAAALAGQGEA